MKYVPRLPATNNSTICDINCCSGWRDNEEDFPLGLIYEGINNNGILPLIHLLKLVESQYYSGASAAQSPAFQVFDATFQIHHKTEYLRRMREYMAKEHRQLIEEIESSGIS